MLIVCTSCSPPASPTVAIALPTNEFERAKLCYFASTAVTRESEVAPTVSEAARSFYFEGLAIIARDGRPISYPRLLALSDEFAEGEIPEHPGSWSDIEAACNAAYPLAVGAPAALPAERNARVFMCSFLPHIVAAEYGNAGAASAEADISKYEELTVRMLPIVDAIATEEHVTTEEEFHARAMEGLTESFSAGRPDRVAEACVEAFP